MFFRAENSEKSLQNQIDFVRLYCDRAISHIADIYKLRFKACPCYTSASCGCSSVARKGGAPFFSYILINLFLAKCDRAKQVVRRIIVPLLHPYLKYRTSLTSQTERSQNFFAELNPFRIFVMRQNRIARFTKYIKAFGRISVALLLRVVAVLSQELGVRPLFMQLTDLCSTKCDRTTQAARRIIVPLLHPYLNYRTSLTSQIERLQSAYNHSLWTILKSSPRCSVSFS